VVVGIVKESDQAVYLVPRLLAEAPYGLKGLFRGDRGLDLAFYGDPTRKF
jgi:hypothetical protein